MKLVSDPKFARLPGHTLGLLAAALLASILGWLILRGYRQPGFLLDLANAMLVC